MKKFLTAFAVLLLFVNLAFAQTAQEIIAKHIVTLWNFETGTTEGWTGAGKYAKSCSVNTNPEYVSEGKYSLKIDVTGSTAWNQDVAVNNGPFSPQVNQLVEIMMDVYVPAESVKGMEYQELYVVFSSKSNNWYQLKQQLLVGKNKVALKIDNSKIKEDMWHIYLVVNSSQPFKGPIYVDNIKGRLIGNPGKVVGYVKEKDTGAGVANANIVIGDKLIKSSGDGKFEADVGEDVYKVEVVAFGYRKKTIPEFVVVEGKTNDLGVIELLKEKEPEKQTVNVTIDVNKILRDIDQHKLYGHNQAAWHKPDGYRDNVALEKLKRIKATFIRCPGGDYGNLYDWRTGDVYKEDGGKNWTPEFNYLGGFVPFIKRMDNMTGGAMEVLPIINVMTPFEKTIEERIDYAIQWLQDMRDKGLKVRYVEVGNEPDNKPLFPGPLPPTGNKKWYQMPNSKKVIHWWTKIDNYSKVFNLAAYKIKKAFPDLKVMGPCPMQPMNRQRLEGDPWKAENTAPYWVETFLKNSWQYVDVIAVHEYPLWANNDARALLKKPQETWPTYMPVFKQWIKKYVNSQKGYENKKIEIALTEWNSGEENVMTAELVNALFCADYLGSFIKSGGDMAFLWDLYTQKVGQGGGHGIMDQENDPTNKFSERSHYWVFDLYANRFGTKLIEAASDNPDLSVYASLTDDNKIAIMAINKTTLKIANATIKINGANVGGSGKAWQLSEREYVWSKALYRPIVNTGPSEINVNNTGNTFTYDFPPYSVTVIQLSK